MTDLEKAVVMAHTGITMLAGEKFSIFHKYIEDKLGRPIWTHELASKALWDEINEKTKDDFIAICNDTFGEVKMVLDDSNASDICKALKEETK